MIKNMRNKVIKLQISDLDVHEVQFCYSDRIEVSCTGLYMHFYAHVIRPKLYTVKLGAYRFIYYFLIYFLNHMSLVVRKPAFAYAKTKTQISFAVTAKLISVFVFATQIV